MCVCLNSVQIASDNRQNIVHQKRGWATSCCHGKRRNYSLIPRSFLPPVLVLVAVGKMEGSLGFLAT